MYIVSSQSIHLSLCEQFCLLSSCYMMPFCVLLYYAILCMQLTSTMFLCCRRFDDVIGNGDIAKRLVDWLKRWDAVHLKKTVKVRTHLFYLVYSCPILSHSVLSSTVFLIVWCIILNDKGSIGALDSSDFTIFCLVISRYSSFLHFYYMPFYSSIASSYHLNVF